MPRHYSSATHVLNAINQVNKSNLKQSEVVFGVPGSTPLEVTNTELDVIPTKGNPLDAVVVKYNRWNLADLFVLDPENTQPLYISAAGIRNTYDLLQYVNSRFDTKFAENEFVMESINTTSLPLGYTLKSDRSLAVLGDVAVILVSDVDDSTRTPLFPQFGDLEYPRPPTVIENTSPVGLTAEGELSHSVGISGLNCLVGRNEDLELAVGAQHYRTLTPPQSIERKYTLIGEMPELGWSIPLSIALTSTVRGIHITDLYEITLTVASELEPERPHSWVLKNELGVYGFSDGTLGYSLTRSELDDGYVLQTYLQSKVLIPFLHAEVEIKDSIPLGKYTVQLKADPIDSLVVKPVVLDLMIEVTA